MPNRHALLSPSSSSRWLACTPSARLEASEPARETSYTREGTCAHSFCEIVLNTLLCNGFDYMPDDIKDIVGGADTLAKYSEECKANGWDFDAMADAVKVYTTQVYEDYLAIRAHDADALLIVEGEFNLNEYVPESFGSSDAVIIGGQSLHVYDFKYGKGIKVSATGNSQMRCYGLGSLLSKGELYDIKDVTMTIVQPRLGWTSSEVLTVKSLLAWASEWLKPRAAMAFAGEGLRAPGEHCRFCRIAYKCDALRGYSTSLAMSTPSEMPNDGLSMALKQVPTVKIWLEAVESAAMERALAGEHIDGYKLVEGRSARVIRDKDAAIDRLSKDFAPDAYLKPAELKTITELERTLTKKGFAALLGDLVVKPQGKPTLVADDDPRPVYNQAKSDYSDIINN